MPLSNHELYMVDAGRRNGRRIFTSGWAERLARWFNSHRRRHAEDDVDIDVAPGIYVNGESTPHVDTVSSLTFTTDGHTWTWNGARLVVHSTGVGAEPFEDAPSDFDAASSEGVDRLYE